MGSFPRVLCCSFLFGCWLAGGNWLMWGPAPVMGGSPEVAGNFQPQLRRSSSHRRTQEKIRSELRRSLRSPEERVGTPANQSRCEVSEKKIVAALMRQLLSFVMCPSRPYNDFFCGNINRIDYPMLDILRLLRSD